MKKLILISLLVISSCTFIDAKYNYKKVDSRTFLINATANHDAGSGYADACFEIGAATVALNANKNYFIILDQSLTNDPSYYSNSTPITLKNGSTFISTYNSVTDYWTKRGNIRVFDERPDVDYVIAYRADSIIRKWNLETRTMCRGY